MRRYTHFHYCSTKCNENWHAWIAGPPMWFVCHQRGRTKPCVHHITQGELTCSYCTEPNNPVALAGYVPLFREVDARPVFVVVHDYLFEKVESLKHLQRVVVGRGAAKSDGVHITPALAQQPRYHSTLPERMRPVDLTPTLLAIWRIPELVQWYALQDGTGDNAVSLPPMPTQPVAAPVTLTPDDGQAGDREERNRLFVAAALAGQIGSGGSDHDDAPTRNGKAKKK